jgi:hypothetical protein
MPFLYWLTPSSSLRHDRIEVSRNTVPLAQRRHHEWDNGSFEFGPLRTNGDISKRKTVLKTLRVPDTRYSTTWEVVFLSTYPSWSLRIKRHGPRCWDNDELSRSGRAPCRIFPGSIGFQTRMVIENWWSVVPNENDANAMRLNEHLMKWFVTVGERWRKACVDAFLR